jgi:hypothetical protein
MFIEIWRGKREERWELRMKGRGGEFGGMRRTREKRKGGELGYGGNCGMERNWGKWGCV